MSLHDKNWKWFALPVPMWCVRHHCSFWGLRGDKCPQCKLIETMSQKEGGSND